MAVSKDKFIITYEDGYSLSDSLDRVNEVVYGLIRDGYDINELKIYMNHIILYGNILMIFSDKEIMNETN